MRRTSIWRTLGIEPTADRDVIRRAYTRRLKVTNPEDDAAAFQELRQAYEQALQHAARGEQLVEVPDDLRVEPSEPPADYHRSTETATEQPAPNRAIPPEVLELREQYRRLAASLTDNTVSEETRQELLRALCSSPALDDLSLRLDLESSLASLLLAHRPRSNPLVIRAAELFGWRAHALGAPPAIEAATKCVAAVNYIDKLKNGQHPLSDAYVALTSPPQNFAWRVKGGVTGLAPRVRQLRSFLRVELEAARPELNEDAVRWWDEYLEQPRMSPLMLALCCLVPFMASVAFWRSSPSRAVAAFAAVLVALLLVDWSRLAVQRNLADRLTPPWRLGWLPVLAVATLGAGYVTSESLAVALLGIALFCVVWSFCVSRDSPTTRATPGRNFRAVVPLAAWLFALFLVFESAFAATLVAATAAYWLGSGELALSWDELATKTRQRLIAGVFVIAPLVGAALFVLPARESAAPVAIVLWLALLQHTPAAALDLDLRQTRDRYLWVITVTWAIGVLGFLVALGPQRSATAAASTYFLARTLLTSGLALRGELRRRH